MFRQTTEFARLLTNLEGSYRRLDSGQLTGRNSTASDDTREMNFQKLAALARTDEVCDALDADEKLARKWNRMERRHAGLPV